MFREKIPTMGIRSRKIPVEVKNKLIEAGLSEEIADICGKIAANIGSNTDKAATELETKQIMFFSELEVNEIVEIFKKLAAGKKAEDVKKIKPKDIETKMTTEWNKKLTPDIALFGRMVTSNIFRTIESSIQVAHAISTNRMEHEFDYFTAVDDLQDKDKGLDDQGAAMIGDIEFTSACYYKYFSIDAEGFMYNLLGDKKDDKKLYEEVKNAFIEVVKGFLQGAIFTNPSGKQNTFAAHQLPDAILIEIKDEKVPISYANAFIEPAQPMPKKNLIDASIEAMKKYIENTFKIYKISSKARLWLTTGNFEIDGTTKTTDIDDLLSKMENAIKSSI
jgi:CRISPR system Cascade subunit CasC